MLLKLSQNLFTFSILHTYSTHLFTSNPCFYFNPHLSIANTSITAFQLCLLGYTLHCHWVMHDHALSVSLSLIPVQLPALGRSLNTVPSDPCDVTPVVAASISTTSSWIQMGVTQLHCTACMMLLPTHSDLPYCHMMHYHKRRQDYLHLLLLKPVFSNQPCTHIRNLVVD